LAVEQFALKFGTGTDRRRDGRTDRLGAIRRLSPRSLLVGRSHYNTWWRKTAVVNLQIFMRVDTRVRAELCIRRGNNARP